MGGTYDYTITLQNTGAFNLNSFWYGWIQFLNDLPSVPTNPGNLLGWANTVSGNSIMWANSTGTALAPGQSGIFTFESTSTPAEMTAGIAGESVAYVGGIDFSQGVPGDSTGIFAPTLVAAPEPSSLGLLLAGLLGCLKQVARGIQVAAGANSRINRWRKIRRQNQGEDWLFRRPNPDQHHAVARDGNSK